MGEREEDIRNEPKVSSFRKCFGENTVIKTANQERNKGRALISVWGTFSCKYLRFNQVAIFFLLPLYIFSIFKHPKLTKKL